MECPRCHILNQDSSNFCERCGQVLTNSPASQPWAQQQAVATQSQPPYTPPPQQQWQQPPQSGMMCRRCGGRNMQAVSNTYGKIKRRGFLMTIFHILMILFTGGIWIIYLLIRGGSKGKIKTSVEFVCMNCGNSQH